MAAYRLKRKVGFRKFVITIAKAVTRAHARKRTRVRKSKGEYEHERACVSVDETEKEIGYTDR